MFGNGYFINNTGIYKKVITIPSADVQLMDATTTPYTLVTLSSGVVTPISCYIQCINSSVDYTNYTHLHLVFPSSPLQELATIQENSVGNISNGGFYQFAIGIRQSNKFGVIPDKDISIGWDNLPTAGNGDFIVTLFYTIGN
jgi:hypothetical protein